jgi:hypothetical protein
MTSPQVIFYLWNTSEFLNRTWNKNFQPYILVPGEPQNVNARPINSSSIEVSWDPPIDKDKNGVIRGYQIHVQPKNMVRFCIVKTLIGW